jgi:signal transduction histidine kinase
VRPILIILFLVTACAVAVEPIDSISGIRALSAEEAARRLPVAIEAAVTFRDPARTSLTAHDGKEGIFVELRGDARPELKTGTRLRIEGITQPGGFLPIIECQRATVLGTGALPEPRSISPAELFSPSLDCQWVQVPGIITGIEDGTTFSLVAEISGWTIKLVLPVDANVREQAAQLMQHPVTIRGVVGSVFNEKRQLTGRHFFVPSIDQIIPSESATPDGEAQLRRVDELLRSDATARTRVRIQGVVTHATNDGLYLRGEGGSVFVRAATPAGLAPGTRVEAEGFGAVAPFRPILRAARLTVLDNAPSPQPKPLELFGDQLLEQQAELITLDADFLARREGADEEVVLQCRAGKWFFEATFPPGSKPALRLEAADRVRLTGICELTTTRSLPFTRNVDGFRLHLRDAGDVSILQRAPWWTLRRLLWALGIMGMLSLVSLAWAALLRRRVSKQTEIIKTQIERNAIKDERQRIARELHDTIEQELAGLSVQLRNARQRLAHAPGQAGTSLDLAEKMLRHCREEARTSIRDLRSVALEQRGLHGALEEFLAPLAAECGAQFAIDVEGTPRSLPGSSEIHLLRIAHEAAANAARHAAPRKIRVRLEYGHDTVTLEVSDDGRGFDPEAPAPRGHFGILGMQERANKLNATLSIESKAGSGTTVRIVAPSTNTARSNGYDS